MRPPRGRVVSCHPPMPCGGASTTLPCSGGPTPVFRSLRLSSPFPLVLLFVLLQALVSFCCAGEARRFFAPFARRPIHICFCATVAAIQRYDDIFVFPYVSSADFFFRRCRLFFARPRDRRGRARMWKARVRESDPIFVIRLPVRRYTITLHFQS